MIKLTSPIVITKTETITTAKVCCTVVDEEMKIAKITCKLLNADKKLVEKRFITLEGAEFVTWYNTTYSGTQEQYETWIAAQLKLTGTYQNDAGLT